MAGLSFLDTNGGWFSDRTVRYLAAGRPVLVQDTGFSRHLPTRGLKGLLIVSGDGVYRGPPLFPV